MSFDGWSYKQTHAITSGTTLTNYQIQFTVYKGSGTSTGSTLYCNNHCKDNFSDIRFTVDNSTSLSYWIESYISGTSAVIWVKLPSISTTTLIVYYGNSSATTESNGSNTFTFFDDFEGTALSSKWTSTLESTTPVIENSVLRDTFTVNGTNARQSNGATNDATKITGCKARIVTGGNGCNLRIGIKSSGTGWGTKLCYVRTSSVNEVKPRSEDSSSYGTAIGLYTTGVWYTSEIRHDYSTTFYYRFKETANTTWGSWGSWAITSPGEKIQLMSLNGSGSAMTNEYDWVYQREYVATEPTQGSWSSEQNITDIVINPSPSSGTTPLTTLISILIPTSPITDFELIYGDGNTYSTASLTESVAISHTYNTFGSYTVYAKGYNGTELLEAYSTVTASNNTLSASFTKSQTNNSITFTDTSSGSPNEWFWSFGDGSTSTSKNPTHIYQTPGTYTVTLYASNQQYNGLSTTSVTIDSPTPSVSYTYVTSINSVHFNTTTTVDDSLNESIASYYWDFKDGVASTLQNPTHVYTSIGTYVVSVTITNNYGVTATYSQSIVITDADPYTVKFSPCYEVGGLGHVVTFYDLTVPQTGILTRTWNFGDGGTSTAQNPVHVFATAGIYSPSLTVTYSGGSATLTKINTILINQRTKLLVDELAFNEGFNKFNIMVFIESLVCGDICVRALMLVERLTFTNDDLPEYGLTEFGHSFKGTLTGYGESIYDMLTGFGRKIIIKTPLINLDCFKTLTFMKLKDRIAFKQTFTKNKL